MLCILTCGVTGKPLDTPECPALPGGTPGRVCANLRSFRFFTWAVKQAGAEREPEVRRRHIRSTISCSILNVGSRLYCSPVYNAA